jgi:hypothetical protein
MGTKMISMKSETQSTISNRSVSVDPRKSTITSKITNTTSNQSIKNLTNNLKK